MKTIRDFKEINPLLIEIDKAATKAFNNGLSFTVEYRDNGITDKQFSALHVWIRHCVQHLNNLGLFRLSPVSGKKIPWTESAFKDDVYKVVLKALCDKSSTKDQNTIEPDAIRLAISGHMATAWDTTVTLPEWPQKRG